MTRSSRAAVLAAAVLAGSLSTAAVAAADVTVSPAMLNTTCSLDQLLAATKVVDPIAYDLLVTKYNSEPRWLQGGVVYHFNLLLQKPPAARQAELNTLSDIFPEYVTLFTAAEPVANDIVAKCGAYPVEDPAAWNLSAPAPAPLAPAPAPAPAAPAPAPAA